MSSGTPRSRSSRRPPQKLAGTWVELVGDWRDDAGESPVFRAGDDFDGYVNLVGGTVAQWLGVEVDTTLARLVAPDQADAVALGGRRLRPGAA